MAVVQETAVEATVVVKAVTMAAAMEAAEAMAVAVWRWQRPPGGHDLCSQNTFVIFRPFDAIRRYSAPENIKRRARFGSAPAEATFRV